MENKGREKVSWKFFVAEAVILALVLALGALGLLRVRNLLALYQFIPSAAPVSVAELGVWAAAFLAFVAWAVYFIKKSKIKSAIFKVFFNAFLFLGVFFLAGLWTPSWLSFLLAFCLVFWRARKKNVFLHNAVFLLAAIGAGVRISLNLSPENVFILLLVFSVYDYIAVYKTKHMIKMAKAMFSKNALPGFIIPQKLKGLKEKLENVSLGDKSFLILGGGDILFPLLFSLSFLKFSATRFFVIAVFSFLGLFLGFYLFRSQKTRAPMPALPPIAFSLAIGYLIIIAFF